MCADFSEHTAGADVHESPVSIVEMVHDQRPCDDVSGRLFTVYCLNALQDVRHFQNADQIGSAQNFYLHNSLPPLLVIII